MMTNTAPDTLCCAAILDARRVARDTCRQVLVGLEELPDGSGRFVHMTEAEAKACTAFAAGWLVTPKGEVLVCSGLGSGRVGSAEAGPVATSLQEADADRHGVEAELAE